jgi:toxin secretion/phage lysis holin
MITPFDWKTAPSVVGGLILSAVLSEPKITLVFIVLMGIDFLSGSLNAWRDKDVDSSRSHGGMVKKAQMLLLWGAARALEFSIPIMIDIPVVGQMTLSAGLASMFAVTEFISIVENAGKAGVKLPAVFSERFAKLRQIAGDEAPK